MKNNEDSPFIEKCINALPPEKQEAARLAFHELGEGDGSAISKLLVVMEANAAFASTIPSELNLVAEKLVRELTEIQSRTTEDRTEAEARLAKKLSDLIQQQVPALGKTLAMDRLVGEAEQQKHSLVRLERSVGRLRHLRIGGVLALMLLSVLMVDGVATAVLWNRMPERSASLECRCSTESLAGSQTQFSSLLSAEPRPDLKEPATLF